MSCDKPYLRETGKNPSATLEIPVLHWSPIFNWSYFIMKLNSSVKLDFSMSCDKPYLRETDKTPSAILESNISLEFPRATLEIL